MRTASVKSDTETAEWTGRLSLQVESDPPQSFSAGYELKGSAEQGELALFTPLGSTVAVLSWGPGMATLRSSDNQVRQFDSLDSLAQQATGTAVPVAALFSWLKGEQATQPGWHAELSQLQQGRLSARRISPAPEALLRMVIDR